MGLAEEQLLLVQWVSFSSSFGSYDFLARCSHSNMVTHAVSYDKSLQEYCVVNGACSPPPPELFGGGVSGMRS